MRILLTGASGRLAAHVLGRPAMADHTWRLVSRRPLHGRHEHVVADLVSGDGLDVALADVDAVLHLASSPRRPIDDVAMAEQLVAASERAGVRHLCFISIVGIDQIPLPYYQAKLAAESVIAAGTTPWTIVRVAQFHSFVDEILSGLARVPLLLPVPAGFRVQSIADEEVADHLLALLAHGPSGRVADLVGPEAMTFAEAARVWCDVYRRRRSIVPLPIPGAVARAFRAGANTAPNAPGGRETWEDWLRAHRDTRRHQLA